MVFAIFGFGPLLKSRSPLKVDGIWGLPPIYFSGEVCTGDTVDGESPVKGFNVLQPPKKKCHPGRGQGNLYYNTSLHAYAPTLKSRSNATRAPVVIYF